VEMDAMEADDRSRAFVNTGDGFGVGEARRSLCQATLRQTQGGERGAEDRLAPAIAQALDRRDRLLVIRTGRVEPSALVVQRAPKALEDTGDAPDSHLPEGRDGPVVRGERIGALALFLEQEGAIALRDRMIASIVELDERGERFREVA